MSAPLRVAAIAAVATLVVIAVAVAAGALGNPVGRTPDGSDQPAPSSTPDASVAVPSASASVEPTTPDDEEMLAALAEIEEQVIAMRGLAAADIGPPDLITRDELAVELRELFDEEYPPEEREEDNLALRALGLLGPDEDVAELQLQLLGDTVYGFYDDDEKRMVVVTDGGLNPLAKMTYAHEYTHALQDAEFGLDSLETDAEGEDDRSLARAALREGDASVVMLAWALANLSQQELIEMAADIPTPDLAGIPSWLVSQSQFPYVEGQMWAGALTVDPLDPDFTAIDAAFAAPPDSTEQIIHLDAWEPREAPVAVDVPDLAGGFGDGWREVDNTPLGEAAIGDMLEFHGIAPEVANTAAEGWGGDRARIVTGPDGAFAVAWRLSWDTPQDADEFALAYEAIVAELPFPAIVSTVAADEVLVVHGSDEDVLRQASGIAG